MKIEENKLWGILRISMGVIFLWAFFDKTFGLGFATARENAWIGGVSPTAGFLANATRGPFAGFFQSLAGVALVDWLVMLGFLLIGTALILGIGVKIAGYSGAAMMLLFFLAGFIPPKNNPFLDEHIIYAIVLVLIANAKSGHCLGFGRRWCKTKLVKKNPVLR